MTPADVLYRVEGKAFRSFYQLLGTRPSSSPYISGDSFRSLADHIMDEDCEIDPATVHERDVLFVATHELGRFWLEVLPHIRSSFILITHNSDVNIDEKMAELADDSRIIRWFAQNAVSAHDRIVPIPIGLENKRLHSNGIVADFDRLRRKHQKRKPRIFYGFSVGTNPTERGVALEVLRRASCADQLTWRNGRAYRRELSRYCFVASPPGNGLDCHRTWEALYLGVIPIVRKSYLFDSLPGLPALIVEDWHSIERLSEGTLRTAFEAFSAKLQSCPYIWMGYWANMILAEKTAKK